jgi:hypothetical protein
VAFNGQDHFILQLLGCSTNRFGQLCSKFELRKLLNIVYKGRGLRYFDMAAIVKINIEKASVRQLFNQVYRASNEIDETSSVHGMTKLRLPEHALISSPRNGSRHMLALSRRSFRNFGRECSQPLP